MPEEVSPESKLYVKEEIEKVRKEFKDDLKEARSKATKIFSAVAMIVGLVTGVSVYLSINNAIQEELKGKGIEELKLKAEGYVGNANNYVEQAKGLVADANTCAEKAKDSYKKIVGYETDTEKLSELLKLKSFKFKQGTDNDGYAWVGDIKIIWGSIMTTKNGPQTYKFGHDGFPQACFTVIPSLAGVPHPIPTSDPMNKTHFRFQRLSYFGEYAGGKWLLTYVAIGH